MKTEFLLPMAVLVLAGAVVYTDKRIPPQSQACKAASEANVRDKYGLNGLMRAARDGKAEKIRQWLKTEAYIDIDARDQFGNTPLMKAAFESGDAETVRVLLKAGAYTEAADSSKNTPLMGAAQKGHVDAIKLLLLAGADTEAKNVDNRTALIWAALKGHTEAARLLIVAGADKAAKDKDGKTAFDYWRRESENNKGDEEIEELLKVE